MSCCENTAPWFERPTAPRVSEGDPESSRRRTHQATLPRADLMFGALFTDMFR